jgi:DNA-binding NtrC family response regulator
LDNTPRWCQLGRRQGSATRVTTTSLTHAEVAHGGIAFLDEIGDMDLQMQLKRLKV